MIGWPERGADDGFQTVEIIIGDGLEEDIDRWIVRVVRGEKIEEVSVLGRVGRQRSGLLLQLNDGVTGNHSRVEGVAVAIRHSNI